MQFLYALRSKGVTDARVLTAMEQVNRADFLRGLFADRAFEDMPLPIPCGQTISQPSVVALMTQALNVQPRDKVLEVGTGSGYQAAILSKLSRRVYTVDRHRKLVAEAKAIFDAQDIRRQPRLTRTGPLRPHPCNSRRRGPAWPLDAATARRRHYGAACGTVRRRANLDPRKRA